MKWLFYFTGDKFDLNDHGPTEWMFITHDTLKVNSTFLCQFYLESTNYLVSIE